MHSVQIIQLVIFMFRSLMIIWYVCRKQCVFFSCFTACHCDMQLICCLLWEMVDGNRRQSSLCIFNLSNELNDNVWPILICCTLIHTHIFETTLFVCYRNSHSFFISQTNWQEEGFSSSTRRSKSDKNY